MAKAPFHNPFRDLRRRLEQRGRAPERSPPAPPPLPGPAPVPPAPEAREGDLWAEATAGVRPLDPGPGAAPPPPARGPGDHRHPDDEALEELRALVRGDAPFDIADSDEFIEGWVSGLDPAVVRKLRRGDYAVQGHVDLHGMTRAQAKGAVERAMREARESGKRCLLLVHGRGTHSKDQVPVLKEALRVWLASARFGRQVLAFATARPEDGGAGAIYVLLRRAGR